MTDTQSSDRTQAPNRDPRSWPVGCGSMPVIDGWTGEQTGWWFGFHFTEGGGPEICPRCGLRLKKETRDG